MGFMPKPVRGEVWAVDFEPQAHKEEPGKRARPALNNQTDALNNAGHPTFIVIPGASDVETLPPADTFPLRVARAFPGMTIIELLAMPNAQNDWV
jgi:mRNA interferase MazF